MADVEELARLTIDCALKTHQDLGPGLLESVYEAVLAARLSRLGLKADRQVPIGIQFEGLAFTEAFRADLLVNDRLIVEIKSVERLLPVHAKQVLTYLRLTKQPVGLLINFGGETLKEGVRRLVNNHQPSASSAPLREKTRCLAPALTPRRLTPARSLSHRERETDQPSFEAASAFMSTLGRAPKWLMISAAQIAPSFSDCSSPLPVACPCRKPAANRSPAPVVSTMRSTRMAGIS